LTVLDFFGTWQESSARRIWPRHTQGLTP
jgi:hypothetical protein